MDHAGDSTDHGVSNGGRGGRGEKKYRGMIVTRLVFTVFLSVMMPLIVSLFGIVVFAFGAFFSNSTTVSIPTYCRILSSGVDLRSSKICDPDVINFKGHAFYGDRARFLCRDDYYWTSVFTVEYKEFFSGRLLRAIAEAPKEALPFDCRPDFGTTWLTKSMFKVNETYKCRYTPGIQKADILQDDLFGCQTKNLSNTEVIKRLVTMLLDSFSLNKRKSLPTTLTAVGGIITGVLISACVVITMKMLGSCRFSLMKRWDAGKLQIAILVFHLKRACFVLVYFSLMGWLTLQYSEAIGLKQIFFDKDHFGKRRSRGESRNVFHARL